MNKPAEFVEVNVTFVYATMNAILIKDCDDNEKWIPRTMIHQDSNDQVENFKRNESVDIEMQEWIAKKNDLI